ncbi:sperm-associated antigen 1-like isoform X1 [Hypanus sabinus]|uniref:sperm-associated antigen 1-like isoform X1 n=2 Tax=Hypanus sabinus TaxID=79690 RepID=UPI0028C503F4|nr:sperm-associated antigen 1-like isoform X1 [Hypanus sabinus]
MAKRLQSSVLANPRRLSNSMSSESVSSLMYQGTTKRYNLPVEHLDYSYIEKCTDVKYLEKILIVLRSGDEGYYPDLTAFCEKRVQEMDPRSRALRKSNLPATAADFNKEEWQEITTDFKNWTDKMKKNENEEKYQKTAAGGFISENYVPVRGINASLLSHQNGFGEKKSTVKKRMAPRDYSEWDKFDVEKECAKIDEGKEESKSKTIFNDSISGIEKSIDTTGLTDQEKVVLADREKDKGNEAFRAGDYKEALLYYTRSISVMPNVTAFNNRAQAEIKLQEWKKALDDAEKVLELDPGNLKAYLRHATVHKHLGNHQEAIDDLKKVLQAEPDNSIAKNLLQELERNLKDLQPPMKTQRKGKKICIKTIEDSDEEEQRECADKNKDPNTPVGRETSKVNAVMGNVQKKCSPTRESQTKEKKSGNTAAQKNNKDSDGNLTGLRETERSRHKHETKSENVKNISVSVLREGQESPRTDSNQILSPGSSSQTEKEANSLGALPSAVSKLKSEGNELFKTGQFGDAVMKYSKAITELSESGVDCPAEFSILLSNRAACYLKDGNCSECIKDCTRALELQPFSIKPLLRRAMAYDSIERYRQAYVDYKTVLLIDNRIQVANDSVNRITKALIEEDGSEWREKLSAIPVVPVSAQIHRGEGNSITTVIGNKSQIASGSEDQVQGCSNGTTHPDLGKDVEERFMSLKQQGNSFVKKTQYKEAITKYSECLELKSNECAIYTNRALCYLKLSQYKEAEDDCNTALQVEPTNIKALYRRALAYRGLKNYTASIKDLNKLLELDSNVTEAQKLLLEVSEILEKLGSGAFSKTSSQEKQRKNIQIQEVADSDEEENEGKTSADHESVRSLNVGQVDPMVTERPSNGQESCGSSHLPSEKNIHFKPTNAYEFGQALNVVQAKVDLAGCAELLRNVEPEDLPSMMSNKLEADVFIMIIQAMKEHLLVQYPGLVYRYLVHLCKAERFKIASVIAGKERNQVEELFSSLLQMKSTEFTSEDVQNLARNYDI